MNRIVVSFTSYPKRIDKVENVIKRLTAQTKKADKIVLYLAREQFDTPEVPFDESLYAPYGFEIHWVEKNMGPHTKYFYAMQEYPDDYIITVDDDILYPRTMIEELWQWHDRFPDCVLARRAHRLVFKADGTIDSYKRWDWECPDYIGVSRTDMCATGVGGVLYAPHLFGQEVFDRENIERLCFYQDDLWLMFMEAYYNIPVVVVKDEYTDAEDDEISSSGLSRNININGNDIFMDNLTKHFDKCYMSEEKVLDRMRSSGALYIDDVIATSRDNAINYLAKAAVNGNGILIYGAGRIANRLYKFIRDEQLDAYLPEAFIVDDTQKNPDELFGVSVDDWRNFVNQKQNIIIGLTGATSKTIKKTLIAGGISEDRIIVPDRDVYRIMRLREEI